MELITLHAATLNGATIICGIKHLEITQSVENGTCIVRDEAMKKDNVLIAG